MARQQGGKCRSLHPALGSVTNKVHATRLNINHDHTGEEILGKQLGDTLNTFRSAGIDQQVSRDNVSVLEVISNL